MSKSTSLGSLAVTPAAPLTPAEISNGSRRIHRALPSGALAGGATIVNGPRTILQAGARSRKPQNVTSGDGHGEFWPVLHNTDAGGNPTTGAYATQAVYPNFVFSHTALYAPTLRAPDPDPLEIGIVYIQNRAAFVGVWDFASAKCGNVWCDKGDLANASVQNAYVRPFTAPDGTAFQGVTVQVAADLGGVYHAYMYNYGANGWDELLNDAPASVAAAGGWDMFEYYNGSGGSPCLALPGPVESIGANVFSNGAWHPLDPSNSNTIYHGDTGCFDAPYQPVYYGAVVLVPNSAWKVSLNPVATPTPSPTPNPVGSSWQPIGGNAVDVSVGANGDVWALGPPSIGADYTVFHRVGGTWQQVGGAAVDIAVGPDGSPWAVNASGAIFHLVGGSWQSVGGSATDIAVGANGDVWALGPPSYPGGYSVYHLLSTGWQSVGGAAVDISVAPDGTPWAVDSGGTLYHLVGGSWQTVPGSAADVAVGANGSVWTLGSASYGNGHAVFYWTGTAWQQVGGSAVDISVGPDGLPWAVDSTGAIYQRLR